MAMANHQLGEENEVHEKGQKTRGSGGIILTEKRGDRSALQTIELLTNKGCNVLRTEGQKERI